jgi:hypothetical protein
MGYFGFAIIPDGQVEIRPFRQRLVAIIRDWHYKQGEDPSLNDMLLDNIPVDLVLNGLAMLSSFRLDPKPPFPPSSRNFSLKHLARTQVN